MSKRRMFNVEIVESDAFLDMPLTTQTLYFHLCMNADDDGFVNPKKIMRMIGTQDDDLKVLIAKAYVLQFDSGVIVIKHWTINNLVRADIYRETTYINEKSLLGLNEFGAYTFEKLAKYKLQKVKKPQWIKNRTKKKKQGSNDGTPAVHKRTENGSQYSTVEVSTVKVNPAVTEDVEENTTTGEKHNAVDTLFEDLIDLENVQFRKWYCKTYYTIGHERILVLASQARADGNDPKKLFSKLLRHEIGEEKQTNSTANIEQIFGGKT